MLFTLNFAIINESSNHQPTSTLDVGKNSKLFHDYFLKCSIMTVFFQIQYLKEGMMHHGY